MAKGHEMIRFHPSHRAALHAAKHALGSIEGQAMAMQANDGRWLPIVVLVPEQLYLVPELVAAYSVYATVHKEAVEKISRERLFSALQRSAQMQ